MNYAGIFDAKLSVDGSGLHSQGHAHVETFARHATHAPSDAIIVPDAQLLFHGEFTRSGVDLILSRDGHELLLQDYFKGEKRATLASPDGAHLTGDLVNALTGHTEYAQADGNASAGHVIGHVTKLTGTATAVRNGVSIILHQGDNVEKGDVVESGSNSVLGITFIDGTVFGLSSNARMVLNEMVYDPNGSSNSTLLSLVAGTITFVAGETAKHGDMKIDTPVATMGIRGTAVLVEIDFSIPGQGGAPDAKFQVLVEPDGTTGSYILFDKNTLTPIATVNQAGQQINISQGQISITNAPLPPDVQKLITDVFSLKFSDANPKTFDHFTDTIVPQSLQPIQLANGSTATPVVLLAKTADSAATSGPSGPGSSPSRIAGPPAAVIVDSNGQPSTGFSSAERAGKTGDATDFDTVPFKVNFADFNAGDTPTVSAKFDSFKYQNAAHNDVTATLNSQQLAGIAAVEAKLLIVPNPGNNNNGSADLTYSVPDNAFDFLAAGEQVILTYLVKVDNNFAPSDEVTTLTLTITVTGTNDAPVISTGPQTVTFAAGKTTPGGNLTTNVPTSGTLSFTDVDLTDTHTVSTKLASAALSEGSMAPGPLKIFETALSASIAADSTGTGAGTINWKFVDLPVYLADFVPKGETLTLTYAVTVTDSQNATSTQDVIVTITGTDTPAVVWIATTTAGSPSGGLWSDATNWETGTVPTAIDDAIIITDQLNGLTPSYPVTIDAPAVARSLTMNDFGTSAPVLINQSALTIGDLLSLSADAIVENFGNISIGGLAELLNQSVLQNSGLITLGNGGDFKDQSTITNSGTIDVSGGTLNILVDIANAGGDITVDGTAKATLNGATISGGTLSISGTLDSTGTSAITDVDITNTGLIEATSGLLTIDPAVLVTITNFGTIEANGGELDISGEPVTNTGILRAVNDSTLKLTTTVVTNTGGNVSAESGSTLDLVGATISGGTLSISGTLDSTGTSTIDGVTINNPGILEVTGGTLTIDAASIVNNTGTFEANGGNLIVDTALAGTAKIMGASLLELGASSSIAYSSANIIFANAATGTLKLDHAESFHGTVSGLDDNTLDLGDIAYGTNPTVIYSGTAAGGTLSIFESGVDVADIHLSGDYLGAHWVLADDGSSQHGTNVIEVPGAVTGLDSHGNAIEGSAITAIITDGGQSVTNVTYQWQLDGINILNATAAVYLPTESDEGHALTVNVSYLDALNHTETSFASAGTVQESPTETLSVTINGAPVEGAVITATVTDSDAVGGDVPGSGITYQWYANGQLVHTAVGDNSYTPTEADEGKALTVTALYTDAAGNPESGTSATSAAVAESPSETLSVTINGAPVEGAVITATVTDIHAVGGDVPGSGITYQWYANGQLVHTAVGDNSYTPTEADEGKALTVTALYTDAAGNPESGTSAASAAVAESPTETLSVTINGAPVEGAVITATVTDIHAVGGDVPGSGITYQWYANGQLVHTAVGDNSYTPTEADEGKALTVTALYTDAAGNPESGTSATSAAVAESPSETLSVTINGAPVEGAVITATVTDSDAVGGDVPGSGITYQWYANGQLVHTAVGDNGYTPTEADEGKALTVTALYTDAAGNPESGTSATSAAVAESPSETLSVTINGAPVEGAVITATVTDIHAVGGDVPGSGITYQWYANGQLVHTAVGDNSYTPTEADEGKALTVTALYTDAAGNPESGTSAASAAVAESPTETLSVTINGAPVEGAVITATVTDIHAVGGDVPGSGITYQWYANGQLVHTAVGDNSYTPTEADEGKALTVTALYTDAAGNPESGTSATSAAVAESPSETLSVTINGAPVEGAVITATVTDIHAVGGDVPGSGITYQWYANGQLVHTAVGDNSYTPTEADEGKALTVTALYTDAAGNPESGTSAASAAVAESPTEKLNVVINGVATEGQTLTAAVTDPNAVGGDVGTATIAYKWYEGGTLVHTGVGDNSYTLTEADEGKALTVTASFTDAAGNLESGTSAASAAVAENPTNDLVATLDITTARQGAAIHVTGVTDGGTAVTAGLSYAWQVSNSADGHTGWTTVGSNASYTPTEANEGKYLQLVVTDASDPASNEVTTKSLGLIGESASNDLVATLDSTTAKDGVTIHVTGVTDGGIPVSTGLSYAWQVSSDNGQHWTTVGRASSYTPGDADEGKLMQLIVTAADATGSESSTYSLGTPTDLIATLDSTTAEQGVAIHVTGVTEGGSPGSTGLSYAWQVSSDSGQHWTTVGTNSSYTPVAADAGELLQVVVTYVDSGEHESTTDSVGTVAPAKVWNGGSHDWQTGGQWTSSGAPTSSDNAVVGVSGTYTVSISQDAVAHALIVTDAGATVEVFGGHTLTLGADLTIAAGTFKIDSGGTLKDVAASATITGALTDNGSLEAAGGTLEIASSAISGTGTLKIDAGATLQLDHTDSLGVTFAAASGELSLLDPAHFTGRIAGITGSGDVLDLHGFAAVTTTARTGVGSYDHTTNTTTLTVTDSSDHLTETFKLAGDYSASTWTVTDDGHGGANIVDPPASPGQAVDAVVAHDPGPAASETIVASAPNQTLTGAGTSDTFVFNFVGVGHDTVTDFHPGADALQFLAPMFANAQAAFSAAHDDGQGNTVVALDAQDTITLTGILKTQLHVSDFHVV